MKWMPFYATAPSWGRGLRFGRPRRWWVTVSFKIIRDPVIPDLPDLFFDFHVHTWSLGFCVSYNTLGGLRKHELVGRRHSAAPSAQ